MTPQQKLDIEIHCNDLDRLLKNLEDSAIDMLHNLKMKDISIIAMRINEVKTQTLEIQKILGILGYRLTYDGEFHIEERK